MQANNDSFFVAILSISITASIAAAVVLVLRLVLKGTPRWITCLLWGLVAFRLLCPFALQSDASLMPEVSVDNGAASDYTQTENGLASMQSTVTISFYDSESLRLKPSEKSADIGNGGYTARNNPRGNCHRLGRV